MKQATVGLLPCPKCGSDDTLMSYRESRWEDSFLARCANRGEHFARSCRRCGFRWCTDDVLPAPPVSSVLPVGQVNP